MAGSDHNTADEEWSHVGIAGKTALIFAGTFIAIGLFAIGPALPVVQARFADEPHAGLLVQLIGGLVPPVFALGSPVAGRLVTRFGVRTVYLASLAIFMAGGVGPAICTSLAQMLLFRIVLGIGVAGAFTAGMAGIARVPERQRHLLYGFTAFVGGGICILAFPMVGVLAKDNWRLAFLVHLLLVPTALFALRLPRRRAAPRTVALGSSATAARLAGVPPQLLLLAAMIGWAMVGSTLYSPFLLASIGVTNPSTVGGILGITSICSLAGSGSYGFAQKLIGTKGLVLAAPSIAATGCLIMAISGTLVITVAGLGLLSVGLALFGAAGYAGAIEAIGPAGDSGAATGMISLGLYLPQVLFPMIANALGTRFGPASVYLLLGMLLVLGFAAVAVRPLRPPQA